MAIYDTTYRNVTYLLDTVEVWPTLKDPLGYVFTPNISSSRFNYSTDQVEIVFPTFT